MTILEINNTIGRIFTNFLMDDDFRGDLTALNRIVLDSVRNTNWIFPAIYSNENPSWIAWEAFITWIKTKLDSEYGIALNEDVLREYVGSWFTALFRDHHDALRPVIAYIELLRQNAEKEEAYTMFITQEQLNLVLDNYFTMTDAHIFNQQYFDHSMQLILDNHHDLYDLMRCSSYNRASLAFEALRRFADEACKNEYGDIEGITTYMLIRWVWSKDETDTYSLAILDNTINYIDNKRAEAQKKKEESTMKNINSNIDIDTIGTDITCAKCGQIVATPEAGEITHFEVVDGEIVCEDCLDDKTVICEECGDRILLDNAVEIDGKYYCHDCLEREFVQCCICGSWIRKDYATECDGDFYCDDCRLDELFYCENCNHWYHQDEEHYIESEDESFCDVCFDDLFTECEHCGNPVRRSETIDVLVDDRGRHEDWCSSCADDYAWVCDGCGDLYSYDVDSVDSDWDRYCPACAGDQPFQYSDDIDSWCSPHRRMNYSFKPLPCLCATDSERETVGDDWRKKIVFYGFELEVDRSDKCYKEDEWSGRIVDYLTSTYCKQDCSLDMGGSYSGIEIVSHPATLAWYEDHKQNFEGAFSMLKEGHWLSHDAGTCGLHVHISLHALEDANPYAVNNMLFLFDRFWDNFVKFSRRTESQLNRWARRYSTAHGTYEKIKDMAKRDCDRYMAVNLQNTHTVELRMFRGTLNIETFFATLQLVDTLVRRCIEIGNDVRRLQSITWAELVASDHAELNAYLERRGLKEGAVMLPEPPECDDSDIPAVTSMDGFSIGDRVICNLALNAQAVNVPEWLRHGTVIGFSDEFDIGVRMDFHDRLESDYHIWFHTCLDISESSDSRWFSANELAHV